MENVKHSKAKPFKRVTFDQVIIGKPFGFNGTDWIKKSTRTASIYGQPLTWFYFRKTDLCITVFYTK